MSPDESLRVLHLTDPHLHADPGTELYGVKTDSSFRAVLARALGDADWQPDAVLATGDLVEDRSRQGYERFREIMQPCGLPILCLPGNHDNPALMSQILDGDAFSYCATHDIGRWRLIMLNSHVDGDEGGALGDLELERLEAALADSHRRHVLVCVHHQPIDMGSAWIDNFGLRNGPDLLSMLNRYAQVQGVLWGHVHQASDRKHKNLRMLSTPSTCAQFTPGTKTCVMDTRPPGFRRLILGADGGIETEVVWLEDWTLTERPPDSRVGEQTFESD
jgi:Icc protein